MLKTVTKLGALVLICALAVVLLIRLGVADSVLNFDWKTSERLLLSEEQAQKAEPFSIKFSPRGSHTTYAIKEQQGDKDRHHLYLDGQELGVYAYIWEALFSPDGRRSAFLVQGLGSEGPTYFVIDGREQTKYGYVRSQSAAFSPDGASFGYYARTEKASLMVVNAAAGKPYYMVWRIGRDGKAPLVFSGNGKHHAYSAYQDKKNLLVRDGSEFPCGWCPDMLPVLSFDGARWASVDCESKSPESKMRAQVIVDGQPFGNEYGRIANSPVFSHDGRRIAFGANTVWAIGKDAEGTGLIVVDGKDLPARYEFVRTIVFSPDAKRLAYEAKRKGKFVVVLDGQESKEYTLVHPRSLVFSPDSRRFAYRVSSEQGEFMVVDGAEQGPYKRILTAPAFSPDSRHVAYLAASDKNQFAVIDAEARNTFDEVSVPDSGTDALRRDYLRLEFEPLQFIDRDSFGYVAKRGGTYYWIEERRVRRLSPSKTKSKQ